MSVPETAFVPHLEAARKRAEVCREFQEHIDAFEIEQTEKTTLQSLTEPRKGKLKVTLHNNIGNSLESTIAFDTTTEQGIKTLIKDVKWLLDPNRPDRPTQPEVTIEILPD